MNFNTLMKTQKLKKIAFFLFAPFILVSCFNNDSETELEVYTDAFLIKKMVGTEPMYAVAFYAYGNQTMSSGTVTEVGGSGALVNLGNNPSTIFTLSKIPVESDYKPYPPANTEYKFKVIASSGAIDESTDKLIVKNLSTPTITKTEFGENKKLVNVAWTAVPNIDGYVVKVADKTGSFIYSTESLKSSVTSFTVNMMAGNWSKTIVSGETYSIQVHAFVYEADADDFYNVYNVEEISIAEKTLPWVLE